MQRKAAEQLGLVSELLEISGEIEHCYSHA